jgi:hypothetical protein
MGLRHVAMRIVASSRQIVNDRLEEFYAPGLLLLLQQHTRFFTRNKVSTTVWDSQYVVASKPNPSLMLVRVDDERFRSVQWSSGKSFGAISLEPSPPPLHHHHHHHEQPPARPESSEQVPLEPASTSAPIEVSHRSSVDVAETAKFAAIAASWYAGTLSLSLNFFPISFDFLVRKEMAFLMGRCNAEYCCVPLGRWDYQGPFKPLHIMNQIRISFIRSAICRHFRFENNCLMYECTVHLHSYQLFFF